MNKKGQMNAEIGMLLAVFVAVIVGAVLYVAIAGFVGTTQNTVFSTQSVVVPADGETVDMDGMELIDTPVAYNASESIDSGNYTIEETVSATTSQKTISYTAVGSEYEGQTISVNLTRGDDGYIEDGGARGVAALITILVALVIGVVAIVPAARSKVLDMVR